LKMPDKHPGGGMGTHGIDWDINESFELLYL
jgi:hypothetical protein